MNIMNNKKDHKKNDLVEKMSKLKIRGWSLRNTSTKMREFLDYYKIEDKYIYENHGEEKQKIFISKEYKDLLYVLLRSDSKNPYKKECNFDKNYLYKLKDYYDEVVNSINEELDADDRYNIINTYQYITMIQERKGIEKVLEKINEFEVAMSKVSLKDRADFFKDMYLFLDEMILRLYEYKYDREEQEHMMRYESLKNIQLGDEITKSQEIIKLMVIEKEIKEQNKFKNIDQFLANKLKEKMKNSTYQNDFDYAKDRERKKLNKEKANILVRKYQNKYYEYLRKENGLSKEEAVLLKLKEKEDLINEINSYIESINNEFDAITTIEDEYENIVKNNYNNIHCDMKEKSYYEGYLDFIKEIKKECENYKKY